jgi:hypothetical protein
VVCEKHGLGGILLMVTPRHLLRVYEQLADMLVILRDVA